MIILDENKTTISDSKYYYSMGGGSLNSVEHFLLVDGQLEEIYSYQPEAQTSPKKRHTTEVSDFVCRVERKLLIRQDEAVYFNQNCLYEQGVLDSVRTLVETESGSEVSLISVSFGELSAIFDGLGSRELFAFSTGRPLWVSRALDKPLGRGERGNSDRTGRLRRAVFTWSLICEAVVHQSFAKAKEDRKAFVHRNTDVAKNARTLVQYAIGDSSGQIQVDLELPHLGLNKIVLEPSALQTIRTKFKASLFGGGIRLRRTSKKKLKGTIRRRGPKPKQPKSKKDVRSDPRTDPAFRSSHSRISSDLKRDVENFAALNPGLNFDHVATARWSLHVLQMLRVALSESISLDRSRVEARKKLALANGQNATTSIVRDFSLEGLRTLKGFRAVKGRPKPDEVRFSAHNVMGLQDAAVVAFIGGVNPGLFQEHYLFEAQELQALYRVSFWLGQFYRRESAYLSPDVAQSYLHLQSLTEAPGTDRKIDQLKQALSTITSFLMPVGLEHLQEVARLVAADKIDRQLIAVRPEYHPVASSRPLPKRRLLRKASETSPGYLPMPTLIPAGRLITPGDYATEWFPRCDDLVKILEET